MLDYDAVIVGSGPNGLAAAIELARAGWSVLVLEGQPTVGGGSRSEALTLPGFVHDVCSAIHPLGLGSPFFTSLPLADFGLEWIQPDLPLAHPLDESGSAALLSRSFAETGASLGSTADALAWQRLTAPFVDHWDELAADLLGPFPLPPQHLIPLSIFGLQALRPAADLARGWFRDPAARALFAGVAAHSMLPLNQIATASFGLVLAILAHKLGWPLPRGGSQQISTAMVGYLHTFKAEVVTNHPVKLLKELPSAKAILLDVTPRQLLQIAGDALPVGYRRALENYRYGPGVFKVDWALSAPIPWKNPNVARAGTVHVGGPLEAIVESEAQASAGRISEHPFVLVAQQSLFDPTRAPEGKHTGWAYCHVPNGSTVDMTDAIERQIERFAPGFRDVILARHTANTQQMQAYNANYIGGDINGGVQDLRQLRTRPVARRVPYSTPIKGVYLCSSATPPGGGVHGMCGYHAARAVLKQI